MANVALKRVLVGRPLATSKAEHQLLPKSLALPVFSSDAISSNAYATQEMMLVLAAAGAGALAFRVPIALAIAALLVIVVISYRQTVFAYPSGGGSYIVAHENLGTLPGLTAAAALLSDYILTVAVSVVAGTDAITSAVPSLEDNRVTLAVAFVILLTLANLRGVREAGFVFALPTYGFVAMVYLVLVVGFIRCLSGCPQAATAHLPLGATAAASTFLILRAFSSGATALTGVEAISNGVQAFRRPQAKNAAGTLGIMGAFTVTMFLGITLQTVLFHVRVTEELAATRSVLSQLGDTVFGRTIPFYLLQVLTAGILILAANTSYQDFPRLSAILARDRFMPSQFRNRGDRLVFSNGIVILAFLATLLIILFDADLTRLIQLYVVGVFTAFTLSQAGMVRRWWRLKEPGWHHRLTINAIGAVATGVVLVIVAITKFSHGAWIVLAAMPVIIAFFLGVHRHYTGMAKVLRATRVPPARGLPNIFVLLVHNLGPATAKAVAYLRAVHPEEVFPLFVGDAELFDDASRRWGSIAPRLGSLQRLQVDEGRLIRSLRAHLRTIRSDGRNAREGFITVVVPEEVPSRSLFRYVLRRSRFWLKASLFFEAGVVVTDVPMLPEERDPAFSDAEHPLQPARNVVLVPVAAVNSATARAVSYATSLDAAEVEALFFSGEPGEEMELAGNWMDWKMGIPLSIVDDPFRDLSMPLLDEIRKRTSRPGTIVTVVLPELVVARWWEHLLHNQTTLFMKRLLLFEPGVVVTSVPFHLSRRHEPQAASLSGGDGHR